MLMLGSTQQANAQLQVVVPDVMNFADQQITMTASDKDSIQKWANVLVRNNKFLRKYTDRADAFMPIIERIMDEEGAPQDLKYIVLVESSLISDLVSTSNAVGYWQFKYATARDFKLRCDSLVDQRMNIVASSRAAARYLINNNRILNNWLFSVVSYYQGLTGAQMMMGKGLIGVKDFELRQLNHKYAYKVLAHKLVFQDLLYRNGLPLLQVAEYEECEGKAMSDIATLAGVKLEDLQDYNKWLRLDTVPTDLDYTVIVPYTSENKQLVLAMLNKPVVGVSENLEPYEGKKVFFNLITVKDPVVDTSGKSPEYKSTVPLFFTWNGLKAIMARPGDNINKLALQGSIDRDDFLDYNDMKVFDLITVGQVYYLEAKRRKGKIPFHVVRDGETMWVIAQNYGVRLKHLLRKNRMDQAEKLKAGRVIWLRRDRPENEPIEYREVPKEQTLVPRFNAPIATIPPAPRANNRAVRPAVTPPKPATVTPKVTKPADTPAVKTAEPEIPAKADQPSTPTEPEVVPAQEKPAVNPYADLKPVEVETDQESDSSLRAEYEAAKMAPAEADTAKVVAKPAMPSVQPQTPVSPTVAPVSPPSKAPVTTAPIPMPVDTAQPGAKLPPVPRYQQYVLEPGETLLTVAEKLQVPLDSIISWNQINEGTLLKPGITIRFRPAAELQFEQEAKEARERQAKAKPAPVTLPAVTPKKQPELAPPMPPAPKPKPDEPAVVPTTKPVQKQVPSPAPSTTQPNKQPTEQPKPTEPSKPSPTKPSTPKQEPTPAKTEPTASGPTYHTVAPGETLYRISKQYSLTVQQLLDLNGKTTNSISTGEKLIVKK